VERIFEWSEGNPFYAEQLAAAGAGDALMVLPATLADVLLARIQALTGPAQELLRAAAVAGRRVPHRLLAQVLGWPEPDLEEALRTTIGARCPDGRCQYPHVPRRHDPLLGHSQ
jgi:predicted ATPase